MAAWSDTPTGGAKNNLFGRNVEIIKVSKTGPFRLVIDDVEQSALPQEGISRTLAEAKRIAFDFLRELSDAERSRNAPVASEDPAAILLAHRTKMLELAISMLNAFPQSLAPTVDNIGGRIKVTIKIADTFSRYVHDRTPSPVESIK